jgi:hypothetical protein
MTIVELVGIMLMLLIVVLSLVGERIVIRLDRLIAMFEEEERP